MYERLMASGKIYLVTANVRSQLVIRYVVCSRLTEERDVKFAWDEICTQAVEEEPTIVMDAVTDSVTVGVTKIRLDEERVVKTLTKG